MTGEADMHWFDKLCGVRRPVWEGRIEPLLEGVNPRELGKRRTELEAEFAKNARDGLHRLENEITQKIAQTAAILTAATLLIAVYALKPSLQALGVYLAIALCFAAVAFVAALVPLTPPIRRAWFSPYEATHEWTLLTYDHYTNWVMDSYLSDRRKAVLTKYKRAHAVAVPILVAAAAVIAVGAITNTIPG